MTLELLRDVAAGLFLFAGAFFLIVGAIGMNRMPDLFTRMHSASVADTLGVILMLIGMVILAGFTLVAVKLMLLMAFLLFMGPVASHALAAAALQAGVKPVLASDGKRHAPAVAPKKPAGKPKALAPKGPASKSPARKGRKP
ncbi:monovalent cation/H(+) antiporter subunit G [Kaistia granuli]|uniref:monovalent cation/H(+) antiporter subunit G n=1 Tax=Kaistia granuli TaxID=363259 RepID=UPI00035FE07D|nr:monovalent cation/H(+) antiporter subunit G [Kaistia granuli]